MNLGCENKARDREREGERATKERLLDAINEQMEGPGEEGPTRGIGTPT